MDFHNVEEKVIFDKLVRMSTSGGIVADDFGVTDVMPEDYPSCLSKEQAKAMMTLGMDGRKEMRRLQYNTADRPELTSHGGIKGKLLGFIHQVARKLFMRWYVFPIAEQQTSFNISAVRAADASAALQAQFIQAFREMEKSIQQQQERIDALEKALKLQEPQSGSDTADDNGDS